MVKLQLKEGKFIEHEKGCRCGKCFYIDGLLRDNFDRIKESIKKNWDYVYVIDGEVGCLTGDTIINVNRCTLGRRFRLDYMFKQFHKRTFKSSDKMWNLKHPTYVRSYDGTSIRLHKIKDVVYSGKKEVYLLNLENGKNIKGTLNHKIMTRKGWKELQDLTKEDEVMCDTLRPQRGGQRSFKYKDVQLKGGYHPYQNKIKRIEVHRLIYESRMNDLSFTDYMDILWNDEEKTNELKFINPSKYHVHHKDGCHYNNSIDNLELLDKSNHSLLHSKEGESFRNFNQGIPIFSKVINKEYVGVEKTYDIICEDPNHNFIANGMVVHNSGKSVFTMLLAYYSSDGDFVLDEIVFKPEEFRKQVLKSPKYNAIQFDEAFRGMSSRSSLTATNKILQSLMQEIRARNLFIFIVLPSIWDLDKYVRLFRCKGLFHIHTKKDKTRGYFRFFANEENPSTSFSYFKKFFSNKSNEYTYPKYDNFHGDFREFYPVNKEGYEKKKDDVLGSYSFEDNKEKNAVFVRQKYGKIINNNIKSLIPKLKQIERASLLNINVKTLGRWEKGQDLEQMKRFTGSNDGDKNENKDTKEIK